MIESTAVPIIAALVAVSALLQVVAAALLMVIFHRQNSFSLRIVRAHSDILDRLLNMMEQRMDGPQYLQWDAAPESATDADKRQSPSREEVRPPT